MTMNPLPPQAYTKDTLLKAYSWLQNQPSNIKEMASTPDVLVSLYLKTTRDGEGALTRPSIQNFKNELKQLAGLMGDLEASPAPQIPASNSQGQNSHIQTQTVQSNQHAASATVAHHSLDNVQNISTISQVSGSLNTHQVHLDSKTWFMIQEVKESLNLSNEMEALRAIIKVGSTRIRNI